jgi:hypothetical protein
MAAARCVARVCSRRTAASLGHSARAWHELAAAIVDDLVIRPQQLSSAPGDVKHAQ